jgi:hypothetical protein
MFEGRDGALWPVSELDGLARFRDGHLLRVPTANDGMPDHEAACMLQTPDGAPGWELRPGCCGLTRRRRRIASRHIRG